MNEWPTKVSRRVEALQFTGGVVMFLVLNRGAYQGFFQDDELDNLSWVTFVPVREWLIALFTPLVSPENFRPVGHAFFLLGARLFHLNFAPYIASLHVLHLTASWLVFLLAKRLGAVAMPAFMAALFFMLNMAAFSALWKPMFVFDVLCTVFCLASILLYANGRILWSLAAFWLAYKSKELAVMLPLILLCYEVWFGERNWKRLVPFFAISLSFGLQALFANQTRDSPYSFRFGWNALAVTAPYYASQIFEFRYGGALLLLVPFFIKDRHIWFGSAFALLALLPLLFLPGRVFDAYCYLPLTGAALVIAGVSQQYRFFGAVFFLLFISIQISHLRDNRRATLALAEETKPLVRQIEAFANTTLLPEAILYDGVPTGQRATYVADAFKIAYHRMDIAPVFVADPAANSAAHRDRVAMLVFDRVKRGVKILVHTKGDPLASYLTLNAETPLWQLGDGWKKRVISTAATAVLNRPFGAASFELLFTGPPVEILIDGKSIGTVTAPSGKLAMPETVAGNTEITFRTPGEAKIKAFGFLTRPGF